MVKGPGGRVIRDDGGRTSWNAKGLGQPFHKQFTWHFETYKDTDTESFALRRFLPEVNKYLADRKTPQGSLHPLTENNFRLIRAGTIPPTKELVEATASVFMAPPVGLVGDPRQDYLEQGYKVAADPEKIAEALAAIEEKRRKAAAADEEERQRATADEEPQGETAAAASAATDNTATPNVTKSDEAIPTPPKSESLRGEDRIPLTVLPNTISLPLVPPPPPLVRGEDRIPLTVLPNPVSLPLVPPPPPPQQMPPKIEAAPPREIAPFHEQLQRHLRQCIGPGKPYENNEEFLAEFKLAACETGQEKLYTIFAGNSLRNPVTGGKMALRNIATETLSLVLGLEGQDYRDFKEASSKARKKEEKRSVIGAEGFDVQFVDARTRVQQRFQQWRERPPTPFAATTEEVIQASEPPVIVKEKRSRTQRKIPPLADALPPAEPLAVEQTDAALAAAETIAAAGAAAELVENLEPPPEPEIPPLPRPPKVRIEKPAEPVAKAPEIPPADTTKEQREAIESARAKFEAMAVYNEQEASNIATVLFKDIVRYSAVLAGAPNVPGEICKLAGCPNKQQSIRDWINGTRNVHPETLIEDRLADKIAGAFLAPPNQAAAAEVSLYLRGIPWAQRTRGHALLEYAKTHKLDRKQLLRLDRLQTGQMVTAYAESLGLTKLEYDNIFQGYKRGSGVGDKIVQAVIKKAARGFMSVNPEEEVPPEDMRMFRQIAFGIPLDITQEKLNHCFSADAPPKNRIDVVTCEKDQHAFALGDFFRMLGDVYAFRNNGDMASTIASQAGLGETIALELRNAINACSREKGKYIPKPGDRLSRGLSRNFADMVARFAFPAVDGAGTTLQDDCRYFLDRDNYTQDRSEVMARGWETRRAKPSAGHAGNVSRPPGDDSDTAPGTL